MPTLKTIAPPRGRKDDRLFVEDEAGARFEVDVEERQAGNGSPAIVIKAAVLDAAGDAIAVDTATHSHTFTPAELSAPDFDLDARIATIVDATVARAKALKTNRAQVAGIGAKLRGGKIDLKKRLATPATDEGKTQ